MLFVEEPLAVFNYMTQNETARSNESNRSFGRGIQSIRRFIINDSGRRLVDVAYAYAENNGLIGSLAEILASTGHLNLLRRLPTKKFRSIITAYFKDLHSA